MRNIIVIIGLCFWSLTSVAVPKSLEEIRAQYELLVDLVLSGAVLAAVLAGLGTWIKMNLATLAEVMTRFQV